MLVSVVVPTYNRFEVLGTTIKRLLDTTAPRGGREIIVVDDGSTEGDAATYLEAQQQPDLRVIRQSNAGPAVARNRGVHEASGQFVIFVDNDIWVEPDFVARHVAALTEHPACWIQGALIQPPQLRDTPFGRWRAATLEAQNAHLPASGAEIPFGLATGNLSFPRDQFIALGGFDESLSWGEDWDLGIRLRAAGIKVWYDPDLRGWHHDWAADFTSFCRRGRTYAEAQAVLWCKHGQSSGCAPTLEANTFNYSRDGLPETAKKTIKAVIASRIIFSLMQRFTVMIERVYPDSRLSHWLYRTGEAAAMWRGVRAGLDKRSI